jgi:hypothetical protein
MNRLMVMVGQSMVVLALVLSLFGMGRPAAAEGLNTLSFTFSVCPKQSDTCTPYGNTDARIMELATGIEQWTVNDAAGWATFAGLADGEFAFSTPAVKQESITFECVDANGTIVPSWIGEDGPTVTLSGSEAVTCTGMMVPQGGAPSDTAPADVAANSLTFRSLICPEWADICEAYANTDARFLPVATGVEQYVTNDANGWASFGGLADGEYAFSTPAVAQKSVTFECVDANAAIVPSWMTDNGPTVSLFGGIDVTCTTWMVPDSAGPLVDVTGDNSLAFGFQVCPEWTSVCEPYANTDLRIMEIATGTEQYIIGDWQGWGTFGGLADGDYAFSAPAVTQKSINFSCTDENHTPIASWMGENGPTVSLANGVHALCMGTMVPFGPEDQPTQDDIDSLPVSVEIVVAECPAGYIGSDFATDCGNPADASLYSGHLAYGTIPNSFVSLAADFNDYGHAGFYDLLPDHYSAMVSSASAGIAAVTCDIYEGVNDEDAVEIAPALGGSGYEFDAPVDGAVYCSFYMVPVAQVPSETPVASETPAASTTPVASETPAVSTTPVANQQASGKPVTSDKPAASNAPASDSTTLVSLPNTGAGDTSTDAALGGWIALVLLAASGALVAGVAARRVATR